MTGEGAVDVGVSSRSLSVAKVIDRLARAPGTYVIILTIPTRRRAPWRVHFHRQEVIRTMELGR